MVRKLMLYFKLNCVTKKSVRPVYITFTQHLKILLLIILIYYLYPHIYYTIIVLLMYIYKYIYTVIIEYRDIEIWRYDSKGCLLLCFLLFDFTAYLRVFLSW